MHTGCTCSRKRCNSLLFASEQSYNISVTHCEISTQSAVAHQWTLQLDSTQLIMPPEVKQPQNKLIILHNCPPACARACSCINMTDLSVFYIFGCSHGQTCCHARRPCLHTPSICNTNWESPVPPQYISLCLFTVIALSKWSRQ